MGRRWIDGQRRRRAWMALGAAYLLVLQLLVVGFSSAVEAAPGHLDPFGTVICASAHGEAPDSPAPDHSGSHTPACCTLGCAMSVSAAAPPPDAAVVFPPMRADDPVTPAAGENLAARGIGRNPQNARAPPSCV